MNLKSLLFLILPCFAFTLSAQSKYDSTKLVFSKRVRGNISPKSIVYGAEKLFAQNMMYRHSITIYNTSGELIRTIKDTITPSKYGDTTKLKRYEGSPVEAAITADKKHMWISNYQMFGDDFKKPGCDACNKKNTYDHSYLYAVNTTTLKVDKIAKTGSVPKFVACSSDGRLLAVSNWSDGTITILNQYNGSFIKAVSVGRHPRGIVFNEANTKIYVAIMGSDNLVEIDISSGEVITHKSIGDGPRHLLYSDDCVYMTLNNQSTVKKWDTKKNTWSSAKVGIQPRSMTFSSDSLYLYVVNYASSTMSKVRATDMKVTQTIKTDGKPIGVTLDPVTNNIWVACYGGTILKFIEYKKEEITKPALVLHQVTKKTNTSYRFNVIIGSFTTKKEAKRYTSKMNKKGFKTVILPKTKGRHRVSAFQTNDETQASKKLKEVQATLRKDAWLLKG